MGVFYISFTLVMIFGFLMKAFNPENWKKPFCIVSGLVYWIIAGCRSYYVGADTLYYTKMFVSIATEDLDYAWDYLDKDKFYAVLVWLVSRFTDEYTVFFFIVAAIFGFSVWFYIYKYSQDPILSVIILFAFNFYQFSLTGFRQVIAMSLVLLGIVALKRDKPILAAVWFGLASLFHLSALSTMILIVFKYIKLTKGLLWTTVPILGLVFLLRSRVANMLIFLVSDRGYSVNDKNSGVTMTLVVLAVYIICVAVSNDFIEKNKNFNLDFWIVIIGVFFQLLTPAQAIFFRVGFYFIITYVTFVPNVIMSVKDQSERLVLNYSLYILLSVQYLFFTMRGGSISEYIPFWQV